MLATGEIRKFLRVRIGTLSAARTGSCRADELEFQAVTVLHPARKAHTGGFRDNRQRFAFVRTDSGEILPSVRALKGTGREDFL